MADPVSQDVPDTRPAVQLLAKKKVSSSHESYVISFTHVSIVFIREQLNMGLIGHGLYTGLVFISLDAGPEKCEQLCMGLTLVRHGLYTDLVIILYCCQTAGQEKLNSIT